jgi:hypothetical protein
MAASICAQDATVTLPGMNHTVFKQRQAYQNMSNAEEPNCQSHEELVRSSLSNTGGPGTYQFYFRSMTSTNASWSVSSE